VATGTTEVLAERSQQVQGLGEIFTTS
jgi:hypothetical protein